MGRHRRSGAKLAISAIGVLACRSTPAAPPEPEPPAPTPAPAPETPRPAEGFAGRLLGSANACEWTPDGLHAELQNVDQGEPGDDCERSLETPAGFEVGDSVWIVSFEGVYRATVDAHLEDSRCVVNGVFAVGLTVEDGRPLEAESTSCFVLVEAPAPSARLGSLSIIDLDGDQGRELLAALERAGVRERLVQDNPRWNEETDEWSDRPLADAGPLLDWTDAVEVAFGPDRAAVAIVTPPPSWADSEGMRNALLVVVSPRGTAIVADWAEFTFGFSSDLDGNGYDEVAMTVSDDHSSSHVVLDPQTLELHWIAGVGSD